MSKPWKEQLERLERHIAEAEEAHQTMRAEGTIGLESGHAYRREQAAFYALALSPRLVARLEAAERALIAVRADPEWCRRRTGDAVNAYDALVKEQG